MSPGAPLPIADRIRGNPLVRLLSSIWFGVTVLALILVYSSVISALPPVRWTLEMTEMQAFRHWVFVVLVVLLGVSMLVATLVRLVADTVNIGALLAHVGLLTLCVGALAYFGLKIEGDVLLQSAAIEVRARSGAQVAVIGRLAAVEGEVWGSPMPDAAGPLVLRVDQVAAEGDALEVGRALLTVLRGDGAAQSVELRAGADGWAPIAENLDARLLTFAPKSEFYDDETPALYVRNPVSGETVMREIGELPIYRDHFPADEEKLVDSRGARVRPTRQRPEVRLLGLRIPTGWLERWRMPIVVDSAGLPFEVEITGYVAYVAGMLPQETDDGEVRERPIVAVREQRRAGISARGMSAVRLQLRGRGADGEWTQAHWCLFSMYPDVDARPLVVRVPGAEAAWEIVYSRLRRDLGAALAARRLSVTYFPGRRGIESYRSDILVREGNGPPRPATVETNQICKVGPWTLYQSGFAEDHWSWTILGVGNRVGLWAMNIGWVTVALGCLYAFYVQPLVARGGRRNVQLALVGLLPILAGCGRSEPYQASQAAAAMDEQIDWSEARLIAVQDAGRYKTLESFARESFADMTGREHLPGLSPLASLLDWVFRRAAYADTPVIQVSSPGVRKRLAAVFGDAAQQRILDSKQLTLREIFDPRVEQILTELESEPLKRRAVGRLRNAQGLAAQMDEYLCIVPEPGGDRVAPWVPPKRVLGSLSDEQLAAIGLRREELPDQSRFRLPNMTPEQAMQITVMWSSLRSAWLRGDAESVQRYLARLSDYLPTLAGAGVYPARSQLRAEARYYAFGKFTRGWMLYFLALLVSVWALVTRWRVPWVLTILLLTAGLGVHAYGLLLRWYILNRIPVANMFEAVVAAAWMAVVVALVLDLVFRKRVFLVAASMTGFVALVMGGYVLPGSALSTIPKILDDIQLRIHTVLIIASYALIFLAAVIALVYLLGYYGDRLGKPGGPPCVLPKWLEDIDWSHKIIIDLVFILLFLGTITGAWWADYSWGRPWGWDPKEVFAMNTWIIYAILIHVRLVVRARGLWTAWLSLAGCAMMAFNWFVVNFFIASVHSYV